MEIYQLKTALLLRAEDELRCFPPDAALALPLLLLLLLSHRDRQ